MRLIPPLSVPGIGRQYKEALPEPTLELCGELGVNIAVGFLPLYLVYRGTFDQRAGTGSWHFLYMGSDQ
jgi:hypothetical protein